MTLRIQGSDIRVFTVLLDLHHRSIVSFSHTFLNIRGPNGNIVPSVPQKVKRLNHHRTEAFCLIIKFSFDFCRKDLT